MPPVVDNKKCNGEGSCVEVCPLSVMEAKGKKCVVAKPDDCNDCQACEAACPNGAISFP